MLIHIGVRPIHDIEVLDFKRKLFIEELPDGTYRIWTKKMLNSGCGKSVRAALVLMDCFYCPTCDEYFSKDQWESKSERHL